jgi:hypothetical protein
MARLTPKSAKTVKNKSKGKTTNARPGIAQNRRPGATAKPSARQKKAAQTQAEEKQQPAAHNPAKLTGSSTGQLRGMARVRDAAQVLAQVEGDLLAKALLEEAKKGGVGCARLFLDLIKPEKEKPVETHDESEFLMLYKKMIAEPEYGEPSDQQPEPAANATARYSTEAADVEMAGTHPKANGDAQMEDGGKPLNDQPRASEAGREDRETTFAGQVP